MHAQTCPCELKPVCRARQHAFLPTSRRHVSQDLKCRRNTPVRSQTRRYHGKAQCRSAQPGLNAGASSDGRHQESVTSRGPIDSEGRETYWPQSFKEITEDAVKAVLAAIEKGYNKLEVEFPPFPASDSKTVDSV